MRTTSAVRTIGASVVLGGLVFAAVAGEGGGGCWDQLWAGLKQSTGVGAERCVRYTNCPTAVKCYPGSLFLTIGTPVQMEVGCKYYAGGTWDPVKKRCVGGEQHDTEETANVMVTPCTDGCN